MEAYCDTETGRQFGQYVYIYCSVPTLPCTHLKVLGLETLNTAVGFSGRLQRVNGNIHVLEVLHHLIDEVEYIQGGVLEGKTLSHSFLRVQRYQVGV